MARAKSTARAEARRRYRAEQARIEAADAPTADDPAAPSQTAAKTADGPRQAPLPQGRVSIGTAFRAAFRPLDVRGDLAALPHLIVGTKALWVPGLLVIASTVLVVVVGYQSPSSTTQTTLPRLIAVFMYQYFVQAPAIGAVFLAGFLAPRASWLIGAIVGLIATICFGILILVFPTSLASTPPTPEEAQVLLVQSVVIALSMGPFFAAAAAWYRRFLQLTNPNRAARSQNRQRADGRTRSGNNQKPGSQKAGAKPR